MGLGWTGKVRGGRWGGGGKGFVSNEGGGGRGGGAGVICVD